MLRSARSIRVELGVEGAQVRAGMHPDEVGAVGAARAACALGALDSAEVVRFDHDPVGQRDV